MNTLVSLVLAQLQVLAYHIDASCNTYTNPSVDDTVREVLNMAQYAGWRIEQESPSIGEVINHY